MSYTPNVPQANQKIAATQAPIEANFQYVNTAMQVNHTFNGNALLGEAAGSHQKVACPNQADIVSLPTGIAAIMYANAGNFYSYNGTKNVMSAVDLSATAATLTATPSTLFTVPPESIGFIMGTAANFSTRFNVYGFMSQGGVLFISYLSNATSAGWTATVSGLNFQVNGTTNTTLAYKAIYWAI